MTYFRLAALALMMTLAACGSRGPRGPGGPGGPSPLQTESASAVACRIAPYADATGAVTREALDKGLRASFAAADTNGDGFLDKKEIATLNAARAGSCDPEPVIDWSGSGHMTYAAYAARTFTLFDRADRDSDGVITGEEIANIGRRLQGPRPPPSPDGR